MLGNQKILFCGIVYAMIVHEDELISLNTSQNSPHIISQYRHRNHVFAVEIRLSGQMADAQVIIAL